MKFRAFFKRFPIHWFAGTELAANWYYYWAKEGDPAVCAYSRDKTKIDYAEYGGNGNKGVRGKYDPKADKITLYDGAATTPLAYKFPEKPAPSGATWVHFEYKAELPTDVVNLCFAHEKTHRITIKATGWPAKPRKGDLDGDCVPDEWEVAVLGMNHRKADSFGGAFTGSNTSGAPRDNEFYSWLSGAYMSGVGKITGNRPSAYNGERPVASKKDLDWSLDGYNWKKKE